MALLQLDQGVVELEQQQPIRVFALQLAGKGLVQRGVLIQQHVSLLPLLFDSAGSILRCGLLRQWYVSGKARGGGPGA